MRCWIYTLSFNLMLDTRCHNLLNWLLTIPEYNWSNWEIFNINDKKVQKIQLLHIIHLIFSLQNSHFPLSFFHYTSSFQRTNSFYKWYLMAKVFSPWNSQRLSLLYPYSAYLGAASAQKTEEQSKVEFPEQQSKPYRAKLLRLDLLAPVSNKWLQKSWSNCASGVGRFCVSLLLLRNSSVSLRCCYDLTGFCSDQRCSGNR